WKAAFWSRGVDFPCKAKYLRPTRVSGRRSWRGWTKSAGGSIRPESDSRGVITVRSGRAAWESPHFAISLVHAFNAGEVAPGRFGPPNSQRSTEESRPEQCASSFLESTTAWAVVL